MKLTSHWLAFSLITAVTTTFSMSAVARPHPYETPEAAVKALVEAARTGDSKAILNVIGPESKPWVFTGDTVSDKTDWQRFLKEYDAKNSLEKIGTNKVILHAGYSDWFFPAPIVMSYGAWAFDPVAGREEVTNRRVGANELSTIQTLLAVVDAQREYAAADKEKDGKDYYALKFISSPGSKDGLYWPTEAEEATSPLGPLVGEASRKGYDVKASHGRPQPYHGYYYKMITKQGANTPDGAYDYLVNGKLMGGFAVVAYPVSYGVSGVKTFVVNHDGKVFEKDLGPETLKTATEMSVYNPDTTWKAVGD
jgi:hypothetical protein